MRRRRRETPRDVIDAALNDANETVLDESEQARVVRAFEDRRVQYSEEFRFSMLRHWSLYDAMTHSPYVATRLQTWREQGRVSLHSLLAHLGLPLEACKQQFTHMSPEHVARLHEKLEQHAPSHGLDDLKFWSFSFSHGFKTRLVASDVVHGVTALLEGTSEGAAEPGEGAEPGAGAFWRAVKALGMSQYDEMRVGLRHAMRSQRALMRQGICPNTGNDAHTGKVDHGYYVQAMSDATYVPSPPGVGFVNYRDTEAIVAGAVPILERPRWPPQRGPFMDLHDELPHLLIKNDTAWASVRNDHLPSHRFGGDARKHYLPYWLCLLYPSPSPRDRG